MSDLYVCLQPCMTRARKFLEIKYSEISSEVSLGQKQSRSSYMACGMLYLIWLSMYAFVKPANIEFPREKVLRLAEKQMG